MRVVLVSPCSDFLPTHPKLNVRDVDLILTVSQSILYTFTYSIPPSTPRITCSHAYSQVMYALKYLRLEKDNIQDHY